MADAVHTRYKDHARREYACHDQRIVESAAGNHFIFHSHLLYSRLNRSLYPFRHTVLGCDIPMYGTYVYTEGEAQADYYFIYGNYETVVRQHKKLV